MAKKNLISKIVSMCLTLIFMLTFNFASAFGAVGFDKPIPETMMENHIKLVEEYRIRIDNIEGGYIEVSNTKGEKWVKIGKVIKPAVNVSNEGYRASGWAKSGTVAATASHAIHIKVAQNNSDPSFPDGRGVLFSIIPREFYTPPEDFGGQPVSDNGIYTNISAGTGIFGPWAPYVGNKVYIEKNNELVPIPITYIPANGDKIVIIVEKPEVMPEYITFENRFGGLITITYNKEAVNKEDIDTNQDYINKDDKTYTKVIGEVLRPVEGVGRFDGTTCTGIGGINTNHTGVITVSTAPFSSSLDINDQGGFQIIPAYHSMDDEMINDRILTQWMVVGPVNVLQPSPDGTAPLFSNYIKPSFYPVYSDTSFRVEVKQKGGNWEPLWKVQGRDDQALTSVAEFRLLFPTKPMILTDSAPITPKFDTVPKLVYESPVSLTGITTPGCKIELDLEGGKSYTTYSLADGSFKYDNIYLNEGTNSFTAKAIDPADRVSDSVYFSIDYKSTLTAPILNNLSEFTNNPTMMVSGVAKPGAMVNIFNNGNLESTISADSKNGTFSGVINLSEGENVITAQAVDLQGNKSPLSNPVKTILDTKPPIIENASPAFGSTIASGNVTILAKVDGTGSPIVYTAMLFNGVSVQPMYDESNGILEYNAGNLSPGTYNYAIYVKDAAGNDMRLPNEGQGSFTVK